MLGCATILLVGGRIVVDSLGCLDPIDLVFRYGCDVHNDRAGSYPPMVCCHRGEESLTTMMMMNIVPAPFYCNYSKNG